MESIKYDTEDFEIPTSIKTEEIEDNYFSSDAGEETMDLEEVVKIARILNSETEDFEEYGIID